MGKQRTSLAALERKEEEHTHTHARTKKMNSVRSVRASRSARVVAGARKAPVTRVARVTKRDLRVRSKAQDMSEQLEQAIDEAKETCDDGTTADCAVAWDNVEEISAEISHKKPKSKTDPLEEFCDDNPEADECRVYED